MEIQSQKHAFRAASFRFALAGLAIAFCAPALAQDEGIKLGVLNDLSGSFADLGGRGSIVAAQMAVDDFGGEVLGQAITIISADTQNKPDIALATARRWIDMEGVDAIIDPVPSSVALGVQELVRETNTISIIASSGLVLTGEHCSSTGFQWAYDTSVLAKGTAAAVVQSGLEDWFFITADVAFGHSLANESKAVVEANGGSVVGEVRHPYISTDFTSFLLQGQASGADVVALANSGADTTNSIKQAMEFGVNQTAKVVALLAFITDIKSLGLETTQGLLLTESFYWTFCDDYLELVKDRAYGTTETGYTPTEVTSARTALAVTTDVVLRLLAPFLPFATEEVWSWWREGSVHTAPWPSAAPLRQAAPEGDVALLHATGGALAALRKVKSEAKVTQRTTFAQVRLELPGADVDHVTSALADLRAAGRVRGDLELTGRSDLEAAVVGAHELDEPPAKR